MKSLPSAFKYLAWPGLMLLTAGVVVGFLNGWTAIAVGLLVVGAIAMVAAISSSSYSGFWQQRSTLAGTNATVSVISVLVILALINFLGVRYSWRTDLTDGQLLTLSPASQEVVENLQQPTELLLFSQVPNPIEKELLDNYRRYNSDFTYRYVDPTLNPQLAQQLNVVTGEEAFLQVEDATGERTIAVQRPAPNEPLTERVLTNKLAQLNQTETPTAYFLQGHGEYDISGAEAGYFEAATRLQEQNYTVAPLNLSEAGTIPSDADVLIISRVQQPLFDNEVSAVDAYLEAGGSAFILIDPQAETGLEGLLSQWGVVLEDAIVLDTSGGGQLVGLGPAAPLVEEYGNHPITEAFGNGRSFYPVSRPLQLTAVEGVEESPLLFTAPRSQAQPLFAGEELVVDPNQEPQGPFVIGAAFTRPPLTAEEAGNESAEEVVDAEDEAVETEDAEVEQTEVEETEAEDTEAENAEVEAQAEVEDPELPDLPLEDSETEESAEETAEESRLVVIGNSSFATDGLFGQQLNGDVFLNSVNWLSKIDSPTLSVQPKDVTNRRFEMTVQQQIFLTLLALVVFPLFGLIASGVLWLKRR